MAKTGMEYNFAFEHIQRDERPVELWRVVFSCAAFNPRAVVLTRYYASRADVDALLDSFNSDTTKALISLDHYVSSQPRRI